MCNIIDLLFHKWNLNFALFEKYLEYCQTWECTPFTNEVDECATDS